MAALTQSAGQVKCRFDFGKKDAINKAHFYCERVKKGIRWKLYLPMNDPVMNSVNLWQTASQRSNCDFKPLVDHHSALEYMTCAPPCARSPQS
jgi:hypothetical protein